jgi:hypothetical protein
MLNKTSIKITVVVVSILLLIAPVFSVPGEAATTGIVLSQSVQITFPNSITFLISAQSNTNITQLRLHYVVDQQKSALVTSEGWAQFTPSNSVSTQWLWDMRKSSLPPNAHVEYWWTAADASGQTAKTSQSIVVFDDNRFKWQSITSGPVTILWYNGTTSFANSLMAAAQDGLRRIENNTGAIPQGSVKIYIYANASDLQSAQLFAPEWEGGVTFVQFNVIAIGISTSELAFGERAVPHELTHWIVEQITFNNYGAGLPVWLSEGLATYGESATLNPSYQNALNSAIKNNQLLSLRSLSSPFSADSSVAYTSYGESNSVVTFMINTYGKAKMQQLLNEFHQGTTYDSALEKIYGFDQDGLYSMWRKSLGSGG